MGCGPRRLPGHAGRGRDAGGPGRHRAGAVLPRADRGRHRRARARVRGLRGGRPVRRGRAGGRMGLPPVPALGPRVGGSWLAGPRRARGRRTPSARARGGSRSSGRGTPRAWTSRRPTRAGRWRSRATSGNGDLETYALSLLGLTEVSAGHLEPGMQLLEEAMAAASAGRVRNVHTLAEAYCNLIMASTDAGDWDRASEWCDLVDEFARERGAMPLVGACRTIHADVLVARGPLARGRAGAPVRARDPRPLHPGDGRAHRGQHGRAAGAPGPPGRGRAAADGPRGAPVVAVRAGPAAHRRRPPAGGGGAAGARPRRPPRATRSGPPQLLAPLVEARLACGDPQGARAAAAQLAGLAEESGIRLVGARAELAAAHVQPGRGPPRRGRGARAPARWPRSRRLGMPLHVGEARLALARALVAESPDVARDEARAAFDAFRELGAVAGHGRRRRRAARAGRGHRRPRPQPGRAHRARARGARAGGAAGCPTPRSPRRW